MMATSIPESVMRLQADAIVHEAELAAFGRGRVIREVSRGMAEAALRKLMNDCTKTQDYMGHKGNHLHLDVCVIEPDELLRMLARARYEGLRDAQQWDRIGFLAPDPLPPGYPKPEGQEEP